MKKLIKEKSGADNVVSGTFSLTLSTLIVKILGVIYKVPLAQLLGEEGMGYFNSAYTVYTFFYLLCTAGVPKAVMILVAEAKEGNGDEKKIVSIALKAFLIMGAIITFIFIALSEPLSNIIGSSRSRATMLAIAPSIVFISLAGVIRGYLNANMNLMTIAVSQIIEGVAKLALGLIFAVFAVRAELELPIVSALTILGVTFGALLGFLYLHICSKSKISNQNIRQKYYKEEKRGIIKRIFSISIPITISATVMSFTGIIDLMIIMRRLIALGYSSSEATALYGNYTTLAIPMFNLAIAIITPVSIAFLPIFTRCKASNNIELMSNSISSALEMSTLLSAPMMIGMIVYSKQILSLLYKNVDVDTGAVLLCLLAPGIFFMSVLLIVNSALESCGMVKAPVISMLAGSVIKLLVSYFLISNKNFGISGAPIGTVICYVSALIVSLNLAVSKCKLKVPVFKVCIMPHACALIAVLTSVIPYEYIARSVNNTLALFVAIAYSGIVYIVLAYFCELFSRKKLDEMSKYTNFA